MKLGRRRPAEGHFKLCLKDYLQTSELPPPPPECDYGVAAASCLSNVFMNDVLGDCVIAAIAHICGVETGNAGDLFTYTQEQIIAAYSAIGGYVPGDPSTDNGCDEVTALNYLVSNGFANGTKLSGWLVLDATNQVEIQLAMYLFENLFFGVELPDGWISPFPSSSGFIWDSAAPDENNGHAFCGVGYNGLGVRIDTWGLIGTVTWAAINSLCTGSAGGQLYVLLTPDQIAKATAKSPAGLDWATLQADFKQLPQTSRGGLT